MWQDKVIEPKMHRTVVCPGGSHMYRINTIMATVKQFWCAINKHPNAMLSYDSNLRVKCPDCGYMSPGFKHEGEDNAEALRDRRPVACGGV